MRVLLINPTLGEAYGQERAMHQLGEELARQGHKVFYLGEYIVGDFDPLGGYALVPGLSRSSWTDRSGKTPLRALLSTIQCVAPQIIHLHDALEARLLRALRRHYPTVFTAHTMAASCPASTRLRKASVCQSKAGLACLFADLHDGCLSDFRNLARKVHALESYRRRDRELKQLPSIIAVSHYVADTLVQNGYAPERVTVVENPIVVRAHASAPAHVPLFVSASRLVKHKGIALALEAFASIRDREWKYYIVGDGPEKGKLERLSQSFGIDERVHFVPRLGQKQLHEFLCNATAFLQTNIGPEPFGLTVSEALAIGVPAIVAKLPCFDSRFENTKGVRLVQPGSRAALSLALVEALEAKMVLPQVAEHSSNTIEVIEKIYQQARSDFLSRPQKRIGALSINGQSSFQVGGG